MWDRWEDIQLPWSSSYRTQDSRLRVLQIQSGGLLGFGGVFVYLFTPFHVYFQINSWEHNGVVKSHITLKPENSQFKYAHATYDLAEYEQIKSLVSLSPWG